MYHNTKKVPKYTHLFLAHKVTAMTKKVGQV